MFTVGVQKAPNHFSSDARLPTKFGLARDDGIAACLVVRGSFASPLQFPLHRTVFRLGAPISLGRVSGRATVGDRADDHRLFRDGLKALLKSQSGFADVAEAGDGDEALDLARKHQPDILLLDLNMPRSGLHAARELCADAAPIRTILLTAEISQEDIVRALQFRVRELC